MKIKITLGGIILSYNQLIPYFSINTLAGIIWKSAENKNKEQAGTWKATQNEKREREKREEIFTVLLKIDR
jgi:hypothetical protein